MFYVENNTIYFYKLEINKEMLKRIRADIISKYSELENVYINNMDSKTAKKKLINSTSVVYNLEVEKVKDKEDLYNVSYSKIIYPQTIKVIDQILNGEMTNYQEVLDIKKSSLPGKEYFDLIISSIKVTEVSRKQFNNIEEYYKALSQSEDDEIKQAAMTLQKKIFYKNK